jgi:2-aminoadipate transaminase
VTVQETSDGIQSRIESRLAERVRSAPAPFFPDPAVPVRFNFDQGIPAPESYPVDDLADYASKAIRSGGIAACEYAAGGMEEMGKGYLGLREVLAERVSRRDGGPFTRKNVLLANGSSNALSLCAAALLDPGDGVIVESLSYPFMLKYLAGRGADVRTVPIDDDGMDIDAVEAQLEAFRAEGVTPKLIYTIATFQVPTGTVLSLERRRRLVQLAAEWNVFVIEDNCYYDMYLDVPPPPTLLSLDTAGLVIQTDSFSKILAPGLRIGYATAHETIIDALATVREDHGVNQMLPRLLESYMNDGMLEPHIARARAINRAKRDAALAALNEHCIPWVSFRVPNGGIYFWLEISPDINLEQVSAHMEAEGVACRPGERFTGDTSGRQFLRMAFLPVPADELVRGVEAMGRALKASATG